PPPGEARRERGVVEGAAAPQDRLQLARLGRGWAWVAAAPGRSCGRSSVWPGRSWVSSPPGRHESGRTTGRLAHATTRPPHAAALAPRRCGRRLAYFREPPVPTRG